MTASLLTAHGLGRRVSGTWLWRHLDLQLERGHLGMLVGPSGTGKSLLLRCLCRLDLPEEGEVRFRTTAVSPHDVPAFRARVIYVQQAPVLVPGTVMENVELPGSFRTHRDHPSGDAEALFRELGKADDFGDQRASRLSGGEGQLVGLVRALLLSPSVLLLDEPTAHLDPETTDRVEGLVKGWVAGGERAVLWTSHDPPQVERMLDGPLIRLGGVTRDGLGGVTRDGPGGATPDGPGGATPDGPAP